MNNKKFILVSIHIIIIAFVLNLYFYEKTKLIEPIFLEHHLDQVLVEGDVLTLYYITNRNDNRKIRFIDIPNLEEGNTFYTFLSEQVYNYYGNYKINVVRFNCNGKNVQIFDTMTIRQLGLLYEDLTYIRPNIGKIVFSTVKSNENLVGSFKYNDSNQNTLYVEYKAVKDLKIESSTHEFTNTVSDILNISINDKHALPIELKKNELLTVESKYNISKHDNRRFNVYNVSEKIYLKSNDNEYQTLVISNIKYSPDLTTLDVYKIVKEKGKFND